MIRTGAGVFSIKVIMLFLSLAVNAAIAHLISPEDFGRFVLIFSLANFAILMCQVGLNQLVVKEVASLHAIEKSSDARLFARMVIKTVLLVAALISTFVALTGDYLFNGHFTNHNLTGVNFFWVGAWIFLGALVSIFAETLRGFKRVVVATALAGPAQFLLLLMMLVAIPMVIDLNAVILFTVLSFIIVFVIAVLLSYQNLSKEGGTQSSESASVFHRGFPFFFAAILVMVFDQIDIWMLGAFSSPEDVALYGAAQRLVRLLIFSLVVINALVPPFVSELYEKGEISKLERLVRNVTTIAAIPSVLVLIAYAFFGDILLGLVYGSYYEAGWLILMILSVGQVANVLTGAGAVLLSMSGNQGALLQVCMVSLLFKGLALWGVFTVDGGYVSVAVVSAILTGFFNLLIVFKCKKRMGIVPLISFNVSGVKTILLRRKGEGENES